MKSLINGKYVEIAEKEISEEYTKIIETEQKEKELQYWQNISYDEAVNIEIRKKYTESQEFSILRQKDEKPTEYQTYYEYCEKCKVLVKEKKAEAEYEAIQNAEEVSE